MRRILLAALPTATLASLGLANSAFAATLSIGTNVAGLSFQQTRIIPSDNFGAVGPNHIVQTANNGFQIYNKQGKVLQASSLDEFFRSTGLPARNAAGNFDSRVIYDPTSQRWFASAADRTDQLGIAQTFPLGNRVVLAVSNSADPTQGWKGLAIPSGDDNNPQFADAPNLGVDADGVSIGVQLFAADLSTTGSTLFTIPKQDLLGPNPNIDRGTAILGVPRQDYGSLVIPVTDFTSPGDGKVDFLSQFTDRQLVRSSLSLQGELSDPTNINVRPFSPPRRAIQPDGTRTLDAGSNSLGGSVIRVGNSIWTVNTSASGSSSDDGARNVLRWYEIDATTNQIKQQGEIGDATHDYIYPSLAVNQTGDVVIGFNRSGLNEFISSYAIAGKTVNGKTNFGQPLLLKAGEANYFRDFGAGRNRWGDYSSTVLDPSDPLSFWTFQNVAGRDNQWFTQITQVRLNAVKTPEPTVNLSTNLGLITAIGFILRRQRRIPRR
jgi:hypothetical protein